MSKSKKKKPVFNKEFERTLSIISGDFFDMISDISNNKKEVKKNDKND